MNILLRILIDLISQGFAPNMTVVLSSTFGSIISTSFTFSWAVDTYKTLDKIIADDSGVLVTLSGTTKYHAFKISNPPRVVVEFSNTLFSAKEKELKENELGTGCGFEG